MSQISSDLAQLKLATGRHEGQEAEAASKITTAAAAAALELQKTQVTHSGNQNVIAVVLGAIAGLSLIASVGMAIYTVSRPTAPIPVYQTPHSSMQLQRI